MKIPTEKEVEALSKEYEELFLALRDLEGKRRDEIRTRMAEFKEKVEKEVDAKYGKQLQEGSDKLQRAKDARDSAIEARALSGEGLPYPIGTKLFEWKHERWSTNSYVKTGRTGVVEVCTRDTVHPDNMRWSRPRLGGWFIRVLKKDGTPSKQYETRFLDRWQPEGKRPA